MRPFPPPALAVVATTCLCASLALADGDLPAPLDAAATVSQRFDPVLAFPERAIVTFTWTGAVVPATEVGGFAKYSFSGYEIQTRDDTVAGEWTTATTGSPPSPLFYTANSPGQTITAYLYALREDAPQRHFDTPFTLGHAHALRLRMWYRTFANGVDATAGYTDAQSPWTEELALTMPPASDGPEPPRAPAQLTLRRNRSSVVLRWKDRSDDETGFEVERSVDRAGFALLTALPAGSRMLVDDALSPSRRYDYRVRAVRDGSRSEWSNVEFTRFPGPAKCPKGRWRPFDGVWELRPVQQPEAEVLGRLVLGDSGTVVTGDGLDAGTAYLGGRFAAEYVAKRLRLPGAKGRQFADSVRGPCRTFDPYGLSLDDWQPGTLSCGIPADPVTREPSYLDLLGGVVDRDGKRVEAFGAFDGRLLRRVTVFDASICHAVSAPAMARPGRLAPFKVTVSNAGPVPLPADFVALDLRVTGGTIVPGSLRADRGTVAAATDTTAIVALGSLGPGASGKEVRTVVRLVVATAEDGADEAVVETSFGELQSNAEIVLPQFEAPRSTGVRLR